ncbi:MAG: hypothetical protein ACLFPR_09455 [Desulfococcaceae bacterium]
MRIFGNASGWRICAALLLPCLVCAPVLTGCGEDERDIIIRQQEQKIEELKRVILVFALVAGLGMAVALIMGNMMGSKTCRDERGQNTDGET